MKFALSSGKSKIYNYEHVGLYASNEDAMYLIYHKFDEKIEYQPKSLKMQFSLKLDRNTDYVGIDCTQVKV